MEFRGRWDDPVDVSVVDPPAPAFQKLVELGGLLRLTEAAWNLCNSDRMREEEEAEPDAGAAEEGGDMEQFRSWLAHLKVDMEIDGFASCFVADAQAASFLVAVVCADTTKFNAKADPFAISLAVLKTTFAKPGWQQKRDALRSGTIDRLLLRLGELQAEEPRRPTRARKFILYPATSSTKRILHETGSNNAAAIATTTTTTGGSSTTASTASTATAAGGVMAGATSSLSAAAAAGTSGATTTTTANAANVSEQSAKQLWRPGYGTGESDSKAVKMDLEREARRVEKAKRTVQTIDCIKAFVDSLVREGEHEDDAAKDIWTELLDALDASCLLRVALAHFFGMTSKAIIDNAAMYTSLLQLFASIADAPKLAPLLVERTGMHKSVVELMKGMKETAEDFEDEDDDETVRKLHVLIETVAAQTERAAALYALTATVSSGEGARGRRKGGERDANEEEEEEDEESEDADDNNNEDGKANSDESSAAHNQLDVRKQYEEMMRDELFKDCDMRVESTVQYSSQFLQAAVEEDAKENGQSKTRQRRLNRDLKALRSTLLLDYGSSVALRIDRTRPHVGQFIIFAPAMTPYDSGAFLFDVFFTAEYPNEPPKVNLQTTGQGRVRFNPNLYQNGRVCLSLLGTWRGGSTKNENWNVEHSNLYQVLVSIQSAILGSEFPYFNEPSCEALWGTEEGELQKRINSNGGYERLRVATIQYAMTQQIRMPPPGFEEAIRIHFSLKKEYILGVCAKWVQEAETSDTRGHLQALQQAVDELKEAFATLPPLAKQQQL